MQKNNIKKIEFVTNELKKISQELEKSGWVICSVDSINPDGHYGLTTSITIAYSNPLPILQIYPEKG